MCEAAGLPGEMEADAAQLVSRMDTALSGIDDAMRRWVWLTSLAGHVRSVQAGQGEPQKLNTTGDDPACPRHWPRHGGRSGCAPRAPAWTTRLLGIVFTMPVLAPPSTVETGESLPIVDTGE